MTATNLRVQFVRDQRNQGRVLTVASLYDQQSARVYFGYAVCAPDKQRLESGEVVKGVGDVFDRVKGRNIAVGRLDAYVEQNRNLDGTAGSVEVPTGMHPNDALFSMLAATDSRYVVNRLAAQQLTTGAIKRANRVLNPKKKQKKAAVTVTVTPNTINGTVIETTVKN